MKRREALSTLSVITGGALVLPQTLLTGCDRGPYPYMLFEWGDTKMLNDIAETILPATEGVPGAKAANVGDFVQLDVTDCFRAVDQKAFIDGYAALKLNIKTQFDSDFIDLDVEQKRGILAQLEADSEAYQVIKSPKAPGHFYDLLKGSVMFGYFTSEIGSTKALQYLPIPGYQKGEIHYNGENAWAL